MRLKEKRAELLAKHIHCGMADTSRRLEAGGWGRSFAEGDMAGIELTDTVVGWMAAADAARQLEIEAGQTHLEDAAFAVARLSLMLELMALDCPPPIVKTIFAHGGPVTWWAAKALIDANRGRHNPAWWHKGQGWLRACACTETYAPSLVESASKAFDGMASIAQGLARYGWFNLTIAENGADTRMRCTWPDKIKDVAASLFLPAAFSPLAFMPDLQVMSPIGRLSLMLELRCWGAEAEIAGEILDTDFLLDLWILRLAEFHRGGEWTPKWMGKSEAWHRSFQAAMQKAQTKFRRGKGGRLRDAQS